MKFPAGILSIPLMFFTAGCARSVALNGSPAIPAAKGEAKGSKDNNKYALVEIRAQILAPPQNLTPAKSVYVARAQAPRGRTVNLGQMTVGENSVGKFNELHRSIDSESS